MRKSAFPMLLLMLAAVVLPIGAQQTGGSDFPFRLEPGYGYLLSWRMLPDAVEFEMSAPTSGWVAVGFEPGTVMDQADMVFGWVTSTGDVRVVDAFSTGVFGPHPPDEELGGTSDVRSVGGSEEGGRTVIRFTRPLVTGDRFDKEIPQQGTLNLIWAYGEDDDFVSFHIAAGYGALEVDRGGAETTAGPSPVSALLLILHAGLMSLGFLCMITGLVIARYFRTKKWWLRMHRPIGIAGALMSGAGLIAGFLMVSLTSGQHIRILHSAFGLLAIALITGTPFLGLAIFRKGGDKARYRIMHRWYGRSTLLLMFVTILLGLQRAGFL